jgi:hypothetical protein
MTIEESIQAVLGPLVSGRCYPLVAPDSHIKPYITYQVISAVNENSLSGDMGITNRRVQVDIYDVTYSSVKTLLGTVQAAMEGASFTCLQLSFRDLYDEEVKTFRESVDFSVWS